MSKTTDTKLAFIKARAEGKSYRTIAKDLKISPSTCYKWQKEYTADIDRLTQEKIAELYEEQRLNKLTRLAALAAHRAKIIEALEQKDYTEVPADKLADMLLKADKAIGEYGDNQRPAQPFSDLWTELNQLYIEAKSGALTPAEISARISLIQRIENNREVLIDFSEIVSKTRPPVTIDYYTDGVTASKVFDKKTTYQSQPD